MYLKELSLDNFRSFKSNTVSFQQDLTILVGENNSGKSNTIDAIRLLTPPLSSRKDIYCQLTDVRFDAGNEFEVSALYSSLSDSQQGRLMTASTDKSMTEVRFGLTYDQVRGGFPPRPELWGGEKGKHPEHGCHDMIRHVYLPALRDAKYTLASGNPTRIYALLKHFLGDEDPDKVAKELSRNANHHLLEKIDQSVDVGLGALTSGVRQQVASIGFSKDEKLIDIARDLKFSLADHGITPEDLSYSGHGYANLLYMATIAVELEQVNNAELTIFLVEEPEAHLHPQLQSAVLAFLKDQAVKSREKKPADGRPAGELQVIVATHSPNLTASVSSRNTVFLRSMSFDGGAGDSENAVMPRRESRSIALSELLGDPKQQKKIDRYIDVTKASFLFGGRMLLVEGIAEALLLPLLAEKFVLDGDEESKRRFRSASFIPIDGVDFEPYIRLLVTPQNEVRIADKVVIVTDGDGPRTYQSGQTPGQARKANYDDIAKTLGADNLCITVINNYSLETELLLAGNDDILRNSFLDIHPDSAGKWDAAVIHTGDDLAEKMHDLFKGARKGDFAQALAERIESGEGFVVPDYLSEAIREVIK
ncbi:ATP-dependent nuclease [Vibrio alginolyticus]|uniref:ATP-dependent nuclease n=1 Tax=Vibrio alginolyticus TaxID=663 RepID=UPI002FF40469